MLQKYEDDPKQTVQLLSRRVDLTKIVQSHCKVYCLGYYYMLYLVPDFHKNPFI